MNIEIYFFSNHQIPFYKRALYILLEILTPIFLRRKKENLPKLVMFKTSCSADPFKAKLGPSKVKPAYNPSIWEAEGGRSLLAMYQVQDQLGLHETLVSRSWEEK